MNTVKFTMTGSDVDSVMDQVKSIYTNTIYIDIKPISDNKFECTVTLGPKVEPKKNLKSTFYYYVQTQGVS